MRYQYLAIEGNIGAGKTTLARLLSAEYNTRLVLEEFEENDFLPKFYKDPERFAFPLELSFVASRFYQLKNNVVEGNLFNDGVIADYFIDKSMIFARQTLPPDEYKLFINLFKIIRQSLPKPEIILYLYLDAERSLKQIKQRGRPYEMQIRLEYLLDIQKSYLDYLNQMNDAIVLLVDCKGLDFVNNQDDYQSLKKLLARSFPKGFHYIDLLGDA